VIPRQLLLFLIAGGTAACVNFGSRILLSEALSFVPAVMLAYVMGMITAFLLNRAFVFTGAANPVAQQARRFVLVNAAAILQTLAISLLLARIVLPALGIVAHAETIAHGFGVVVPVFTSYFLHKHYSFAAPRAVAPP
jgi:putative flippase GtrA